METSQFELKWKWLSASNELRHLVEVALEGRALPGDAERMHDLASTLAEVMNVAISKVPGAKQPCEESQDCVDDQETKQATHRQEIKVTVELPSDLIDKLWPPR